MTRYWATSCPGTVRPHATYTGRPFRRMISQLDRAALRVEARESFGLEVDRPVLMVTGGSQGARKLNQSVAAAAAELGAAGVQVLHIVGPQGEVAPAVTGIPYVVLNYVGRMDLAYAPAAALLCRPGRTPCTGVSAVGHERSGAVSGRSG